MATSGASNTENVFAGVGVDGGVSACDGPEWEELQPGEAAAKWLSSRLARPSQVYFTKNRSTMMSWREHQGVLTLRLHKMFQSAPNLVWEALVSYIGAQDAVAGRVLDRFIQTNPREIESAAEGTALGQCFDLREIFSATNAEFFHNGCLASITWGRAGSTGKGKARRSIILGSYSERENLIRIHPCLDQAFVPRFYLGWVVYHEMLHEVLGVEQTGVRRRVHTPEFIILEESFPQFAEAKAWEKTHLSRLLRFQGPGNR